MNAMLRTRGRRFFARALPSVFVLGGAALAAYLAAEGKGNPIVMGFAGGMLGGVAYAAFDTMMERE